MTRIASKLKQWTSFRRGGYRKDSEGNEYYLSADQLDVFDKANTDIEDDKAFFDWVDGFVKDEGLKALPKWSGGDSGWWSSKSTKDWWQSGIKSGMAWASGNEQKLAIVLQQVAAIIGAVDDSTPPMSVRWMRKGEPSSFTDFDHHIIAIDPKPVLDAKTDDAEALDVVTGHALHESGHSTYTRPLIKQCDDLGPASVAMLLMNILEDVRLERLVADAWPGFAEYFPKALAWAFPRRGSKASPSIWGNLGQKLNAVIVIARWPDMVRTGSWKSDAKTPSGNAKQESVLGDASFDAEIPWWTEWVRAYVNDEVNLHDSVKAGIERLKPDAEMTKREGTEGTIGDMKKRGEELGDALRRLIKELGIEMPCPEDGDGSEGLDEKTADTVEKLAQDRLREEKLKIPDSANGESVQLFHSHPQESDESKRRKFKPSPVIQKLKSVIQLRPDLPQWADRLRRSGDVDEDELYRFGLDDYRLFEQKVIEHYPNAQVTLLVDMSGSMHSGMGGKMKVQHAEELAWLFTEALRTMTGITPKVMGHTANISGNSDVQLYQIWEPGEPLSRLGLISTCPSANNYDGYAIAWCVEDLLDRGRPDDERLLIVLSDGQPAGRSYGGHTAMKHMRRVVDRAERERVGVVQIAIDSSLDAREQATMFKHWVPFTTPAALPVVLQRVISKALNHGA